MRVNHPHLAKIILTLNCANTGVALARRSKCGLGRDAISGCQFFLQEKRYFPAAWELLRTWKREEHLLQAPLTGPFALMATALAWNLTDVAVLIAIGYGGFLRPMEALTRNSKFDEGMRRGGVFAPSKTQ